MAKRYTPYEKRRIQYHISTSVTFAEAFNKAAYELNRTPNGIMLEWHRELKHKTPISVRVNQSYCVINGVKPSKYNKVKDVRKTTLFHRICNWLKLLKHN